MKWGGILPIMKKKRKEVCPMAEIKVTLSANAGVSIQFDNCRIWVDALHEDKQPGFSAVSQALLSQLLESEAFSAPDYICVTHDHPDHWVDQQYLPDDLKGRRYYNYGENKTEKAAEAYWKNIKKK